MLPRRENLSKKELRSQTKVNLLKKRRRVSSNLSLNKNSSRTLPSKTQPRRR